MRTALHYGGLTQAKGFAKYDVLSYNNREVYYEMRKRA